MKPIKLVLRKTKSAVQQVAPNLYYRALAKQNNSLRHGTQGKADAIDPNREVYIFLAHDAGLYYHLISLCLMAKTMQSLGHQVLMVSCRGLLQRCTVKDCAHEPLTLEAKPKQHICTDCENKALKSFAQYGLPHLALEELLSDEFSLALKALTQYQGAIESFEFDGVAFGQLALGETIRNCKLCSYHLSSDYLKQYTGAHTQAVMAMYYAVTSLVSTYQVARVTYFGDYGTVLGMLKQCMQQQIPVTNISHALITNVQRMKVPMMTALSTRDQFWRLSQWPKWQHIPLSTQQIQSIAEDVLFRIKGRGFTIFSPNKSNACELVLDQLNLSKDKKLIVAFTSSLDEVLTTQTQYRALAVEPLDDNGPFQSQIEWLEQLAEYVENSADLQLVIRIHPRELASGVGTKESEHLTKLRSSLAKTYQHVRVVWPEDPISSYDLGELADCIAIAWTSIGMELARLGAPVIAAFQYCPYPKEFVDFEPTAAAYFAKVRQLCQAQGRFASLQAAFRWFYVARMSHVVDLSDVAPGSDFTTLPPFRIPQHAKAIESVLQHGQHMSDLNMKSQQANDNDEEFQGLTDAIETMIASLLELGGQPIVVTDKARVDVSTKAIAVSVGHTPRHITIRQSDSSQERYSPMVARLVSVLTQVRTSTQSEMMYEIL